MDLVSFVEAITRFLNGLQFDDSSVALIALLAGMIGGWKLPLWHAQLKAKRARILSKAQAAPRERE